MAILRIFIMCIARSLWFPYITQQCEYDFVGFLERSTHHLSGSFQFLVLAGWAVAAPSAFPKSGNGLWYNSHAIGKSWSKNWLPVGNGYLAAMTPGGTAQEYTQLNIESLWNGGPLADPRYNGGNKQPSEQAAMADAMKDIRQRIFASPDGTIEEITVLNTDAGAYGSYAGAGYLVSTIALANGTVTNYGRWLDMDRATAHTHWTQNGRNFDRTLFCSYPSQACTQHTTSSSPLPAVNFTFSKYLEVDLPDPEITCFDASTLRIRGNVGLTWEILARAGASGSRSASYVSCKDGVISIGQGAKEAWITWVGGTNFDQDAGDAAHNFTFAGADPHDDLVKTLTAATKSSYAQQLEAHVRDYTSAFGSFKLDLGQKPDLTKTTQVLRDNYRVETGNPYLEWLLFNYGQYMLVASARGKLPANLQGKWAHGYWNAWSADYHANINVQMNYWIAEATGLDVTQSLWDYMEKNWAPRGEYTAKVLYNITRPGAWVVHNEMNIFGHSGMKAYGNSAQWANYPEANAWMMLHVFDHLDYTLDVDWWKRQGWPLLKSTAIFHLERLLVDERFNDSTLVVSPCNSPEQVPITFGCAHSQQLILQLFDAVEKGFSLSGDTDKAFLEEVRSKRAKLDTGIHIGSWGQLQEWKLDMDKKDDTHRHLSHLLGLYPGYVIDQYQPGPTSNYTREQVLNAATVSLKARGNGTGADADSGWEKVWRAACYAQLGSAHTNDFYHILKYSIERNFGPNLFSLYNPFNEDPIFQIDANFGYSAALINGLIQSPDVPPSTEYQPVTLLPTLPAAWAKKGSIKGARVRGGLSVDLEWANGKLGKVTFTPSVKTPSNRKYRVYYGGKVVKEFTSTRGTKVEISL